MNEFIAHITQNAVAQTLIIYSAIIVLGMLLGKIKIKGVSLGVTFVLFVGILAGHLGFTINAEVLNFLKNFGLILFIFTIGLQVGPGFFSSFKTSGLKLNGLTLGVILLDIALTVGLVFIFADVVDAPIMVGIMTGSVTSTPALGAAQEALQQLSSTGALQGEMPPISLGYAVAYPMGVLGIILSMMLLKVIFRVDTKVEESKLETKQESHEKPDILTFRITNSNIDGITLAELKHSFGHEFVATRMLADDRVFIPHANTELHTGNLILVVTRHANARLLQQLLGEEVQYEWKDDDSTMVSRRIVVTRDSVNGKTIGQLHLRSAYNVNITRVERAGISLLAQPDLVLQMGDRVMVVGPLDNIKKAETMLGNTLKKLNDPHIITIFLGILVGILVGSIPIYFPNMPMPVRLGLAGGPLIVAILLGRFGYRLKLITYTTQSANLMLREIGICLFLASVGLASGGKFVETVVSPNGLLWIGCGVLITMVPTLIIGVVARLLKFNYFTICGLIAGSHTNIPPLAYANAMTETDAPAVAYSTVYPLATFLRILSAQILILVLA
jgi:putative transport protein